MSIPLLSSISLTELFEENAGCDEADNGGGLIGLCADDAGARGPEESGNCEDGIEPVGWGGCCPVDHASTGG